MAGERAPAADTRWIAGILRIGLFVSVALMLVAIAWSIGDGHGLDGVRLRPGSLGHARGANAIALLAVLVLAATPAARVLALAVLWTRERDYRFAIVAVVVIAILALATVLGRG